MAMDIELMPFRGIIKRIDFLELRLSLFCHSVIGDSGKWYILCRLTFILVADIWEASTLVRWWRLRWNIANSYSTSLLQWNHAVGKISAASPASIYIINYAKICHVDFDAGINKYYAENGNISSYKHNFIMASCHAEISASCLSWYLPRYLPNDSLWSREADMGHYAAFRGWPITRLWCVSCRGADNSIYDNCATISNQRSTKISIFEM